MNRKKIVTGIVAIVVVFFISGFYVVNASKYEVLYSDMTLEQTNSITHILDQNGISWEYDEGKKALLVRKKDLERINVTQLNHEIQH